MAVVSAIVASGVVSTAAQYQDDDNNEPQAGTIIISVVKAHFFHLFSKPEIFYALYLKKEPDPKKK